MKNINKKWFTFVEMLISISLLSIWIVLIWKFSSTTVVAEGSLKNMMVNQIYWLYNNNYIKSKTWYSKLSILEEKKLEKTLLPESYGLYIDSGKLLWNYIELSIQNRIYNWNTYTRIIDKDYIPLVSNFHYIDSVIWYKTEWWNWENIKSLLIEFINPTWWINFYINEDIFLSEYWKINLDNSENTITEFLKINPNHEYLYFDINIHDNNDKKSFVFRIYKDWTNFIIKK